MVKQYQLLWRIFKTKVSRRFIQSNTEMARTRILQTIRAKSNIPTSHLWFFLECVLDHSFKDVNFLIAPSPIRTEKQLKSDHQDFDMKLL